MDYQADKRLLVHGGSIIAEVDKRDQLLTIRAMHDGILCNAAMICNMSKTQEQFSDVHEDSLYNFHLRLGHSNYDTILVDALFEELKELKVKDLGIVNKFLGMRVEYLPKEGYTLDQSAMIREMVERFDMKN